MKWPVRTEPTKVVVDDKGRLVIHVEPPPTVAPVPLTEDTRTVGERLVLLRKVAWFFDLRGTSNPYVKDGRLVVDVALEADWYAAGKDPEKAVSETMPAQVMFLERPMPPS